ncbi:unnamed protein product [Ilex paraguariensis]|uniref:Exportin-1/Importin-beta-like domain-containing protein n=1 Tax=Ilex paraguariensis TaxID=185542 RepID=A0ABC8QMJ4_9AQUA
MTNTTCNSEFQLIHELCLYVLSASQRLELIRATLATLHAFFSWIPLGYIFESPLVLVRSVPHVSGHSISDGLEHFFQTNHPDHYLCH